MCLSCPLIWDQHAERNKIVKSCSSSHHREYVNPSSIFLISVLIFNPIEILNGETEKEKKTLLVFIQITRSSESSGQESEVQNSRNTEEQGSAWTVGPSFSPIFFSSIAYSSMHVYSQKNERM